ncbi:MAG: LysR substrate-binding domain-containing protein [Steroidobacteraceae bacterium]
MPRPAAPARWTPGPPDRRRRFAAAARAAGARGARARRRRHARRPPRRAVARLDARLFLQQWLLPRLPGFHARHPGIDLYLHTGTRAVDFVRSEFHAAVRFGTGNWPNVQVEKLFDEWLIPVCTPALLARHGPLRSGEDLRNYPLLLHNTTEPWTSWLFDGRVDDGGSGAGGGPRFDDSVATVRAAVAGHGLALARWSLVSEEMARGELVAASERPVRFERSYWFVTPPRTAALAPVVALREWLKAEAAKFPMPPGATRDRRARTP